MVPSLDTKDCLLAFLKFFTRRGVPEQMISDNGTNLTRTDVELKAAYECVRKIQKKIDETCHHFPKIDWKFVPARTPHANGGVERLVSVMKRSLAKLSCVNPKGESLTYHELEALFVRVEGIMN